jgi:hypothetical protein
VVMIRVDTCQDTHLITSGRQQGASSPAQIQYHASCHLLTGLHIGLTSWLHNLLCPCSFVNIVSDRLSGALALAAAVLASVLLSSAMPSELHVVGGHSEES